MRRIQKITFSVIILMIVVVFCIARGQVKGNISGPVKLPGARLVIDAGQFPSIQAAIDALPDEGGVVRLPPGTFEINEPLMMTKSDVLIEGASIREDFY